MNTEQQVAEMLDLAIAMAQLELAVPFPRRLDCFHAELQKLCENFGLTIEPNDDNGTIVVVDAYNNTQSVDLMNL